MSDSFVNINLFVGLAYYGGDVGRGWVDGYYFAVGVDEDGAVALVEVVGFGYLLSGFSGEMVLHRGVKAILAHYCVKQGCVSVKIEVEQVEASTEIIVFHQLVIGAGGYTRCGISRRPEVDQDVFAFEVRDEKRAGGGIIG